MRRSPAVPIVCAINQAYVLPLAVMLASIQEHLSPSSGLVLYLIHNGIPQSGVQILSSIVETRCIVPKRDQLPAARHDAHFPPEASYLLLLADLLPPTLERVLFLDADMLVLDDLTKLWETDMGSNVIAAAADGAVPYCSSVRGVKGWQERGIPAGAVYFNGGVLLIDLQRWRERDVTRRVHQYFETTAEPIDFLHQEALNAVLWNDWKRLDQRWNLLASLAGRPFSRNGLREASRQPGIVHFAGRMKPWRARIGGPFDEEYQRVLHKVADRIPPPPPTARDRFNSLYDRYFRSALYPVERYLWRHRLL